MTPTIALARLQKLPTPVVTTSQAASILGLSTEASSQTLRQLAAAGLVRRVRRGIWALRERIEPLLLAEFLTSPYPGYVSFHTALYLHELISQIPAMIYVASLSRARRIKTDAGTFSVHRIAPDFFGGFDLRSDGVKLATPEKALLDVLYLSGQRGRLFAALPEVDLPEHFKLPVAEAWIRRIKTRRIRTLVSEGLSKILSKSPGSRAPATDP